MPVIDGSPDYLVFLDNVNVDLFIKSWSTNLSVSGEMGHAGMEFLEFDGLRESIDDLTSVTIFVKNMFNGKYDMVFDGEMRVKADASSPANGGILNYTAVQQIHWLQSTQAPTFLSIGNLVNRYTRLLWAAQGLDYTNARHVASVGDTRFAGKTLEEIVQKIFKNVEEMNLVFSNPASVVNFANLSRRMRVMGDISTSLRDGGFTDYFMNQSGEYRETMYVLINDIVSKLNFEFFEDRDGIIRVKPPFWKDDILRSHVIHPIMDLGFNSNTDWNAKVTRVVVNGASSLDGNSDPSADINATLDIPMGIYIGGKFLTGKEIFGSIETTDAPSPMAEKSLHDLLGGYNGTDGVSGSADAAKWLLAIAVSSGYGYRTHPVTGKAGSFHNGCDFPMPVGTSVYCMGTGTVASSGLDGAYGLAITITLTNGAQIFYGHNSQSLVKAGEQVTAGQVIAKSGGAAGDPNSGSSTGSHCHFSYFPPNSNGATSDPMPWLKAIADGTSGGVSIAPRVARGAVTPEDTRDWQEFIVTYYGPTGNQTASGAWPTQSSGGHSVAVDRRVIPLGTTMKIAFGSGSPALALGFGNDTFIAHDTGRNTFEVINDSGSPGYNYYQYVTGRRLDIFVNAEEDSPTWRHAALGREKVKVQFITTPGSQKVNLAGAETAGVSISETGDSGIGTKTTKSSTITLNKNESELMQLTDDELKYGISVATLVQPLIKFTDNNEDAAYAVLGSYAAYMYNILNARVTTATLNLVAMPWLRPGFNIWYDPTGKDEVYYVSSIGHNGSPESGVYTGLGLTYGRKRVDSSGRSFKDVIGEVAFLNESYSTAKDFGQVMPIGEMPAMISEIKTFCESDNEGQMAAHLNKHLRGLYDTGPTSAQVSAQNDVQANAKDEMSDTQDGPTHTGIATTGYINKFSSSMTYDEIASELNTRIDGASSNIKERATKLRKAVSDLASEAAKYWLSLTFAKGE